MLELGMLRLELQVRREVAEVVEEIPELGEPIVRIEYDWTDNEISIYLIWTQFPDTAGYPSKEKVIGLATQFYEAFYSAHFLHKNGDPYSHWFMHKGSTNSREEAVDLTAIGKLMKMKLMISYLNNDGDYPVNERITAEWSPDGSDFISSN